MGLIIGTGGSGGGGAITMYAIIAWDGASTPVPANIPAGVQVTYNGTTYTGTLTAVKGTLNKVRLVYDSTNSNYKQYLTVKSDSAYSWAYVGSTTINLSDYRTSSAQDSIDEDDNDVVAAALLELEARIKAIEQRLSPDGNLGKVNVDELSVIKTFNNYTV